MKSKVSWNLVSATSTVAELRIEDTEMSLRTGRERRGVKQNELEFRNPESSVSFARKISAFNMRSSFNRFNLRICKFK